MNVLILGFNNVIAQNFVKKNYHSTIKIITKNKNFNNEFISFYNYDDLKNEIIFNEIFHDVDVVLNTLGNFNKNHEMDFINYNLPKQICTLIYNYCNKFKKKVNWIQISSLSVYGKPTRNRIIINEKSPIMIHSRYSETKFKLDNYLLHLEENNYFNFIILRVGAIASDKMKNNSLRDLINIILSNKFFYIGDSYNSYLNYIYIDDLILFLNQIIFNENPINKKIKIFNICQNILIGDFVNFVCKKNHIKKPFLKINYYLFKILFSFLNIFLKLPITNQRINFLLNKKTYSNKLIYDTFNFKFKSTYKTIINKL